MAHIWVPDPSSAAASAWAVLELEAESYYLDVMPPRAVARAWPARRPSFPILFRAASERDGESWVVVAPAPSALRVNGLPLGTGIHALADRDELRLEGGGDRCFFSTERVARPVRYPGGAQPVHCPRDRRPIEPGSRAIQCPACSVWHHHPEVEPAVAAEAQVPGDTAEVGTAEAASGSTEPMSCWTYGPTCALCDQPSALDAGFRWTPEGL
jgi:hypothetical protein